MIPSVYELHDILFDLKKCRRYLFENGVSYNTLPCPGCGQNMRPNINRWKFRCPSKTCHRETTMNKYTFFEASRLSANRVLYLAHIWLNGGTVKTAQGLTRSSQKTVVAFFKHFRTLVSSSLKEDAQVIGGPGVIVEVDETKLGKRKYNRGHRVDGVWVVAGVERTGNRKVFLIAVENRNSQTLTEIIRKYVAPGSVVHTDLWRGYSRLNADTGLEHKTVNHSKQFVNITEEESIDNWVLVDKIHTNYIEGTNAAIKRQIPIRSRVHRGIEDHLLEFVWRRKNAAHLWTSFIEALRDIHYDFN